jgi:CDP-glucose 4,6-dehydratase
MVDLGFWKGKKVFLTGHTGFKGGWTVLWLKKLGAVIKGYALAPDTEPSLYKVAKIADGIESQIGDVRDLDALKKSMREFGPEIVIHMAAQPLVLASYNDPVDTYQTNVMGTVNLFEAVRACESVKVVVNVTTDKCYKNNEWVWGYRENEPMGGYDPYSSSKGCSELITSAYRQSFFHAKTSVSLASARAGNVIGGGDWSEDRLIPDALRAFNLEEPVIIRNPLATRPWQHVLEPISGYLTLAQKLYFSDCEYAEGWNFGPNDEGNKSVGEVLDYLVAQWPSDVSWLLDKRAQPHEARLLKLDISKAQERLKWSPSCDLNKALQTIIKWQFAWVNGEDMRIVTLNQIRDFEESSRKLLKP